MRMRSYVRERFKVRASEATRMRELVQRTGMRAD